MIIFLMSQLIFEFMLVPFNLKKKKELIITDRIVHNFITSAVVIVENRRGIYKETCLQVHYSLQDQLVADNIAAIGETIKEKRFIKPDEPEFDSICDRLLQLESPLVYRKAEVGQRDGYLTDAGEFYKVLETAYDKRFTNLFLGSREKQYDTFNNFKHHNRMDVVFRKEK